MLLPQHPTLPNNWRLQPLEIKYTLIDLLYR